MVNYDLPWNPNRIEQRFGRIHRIGQEEVCRLWNLVADNTREGEVFTRLLEKIEEQRKAYGGKVFDVLGEAFTETPLRDLLLDAIQYGERPDVKAKMHEVIDASVGDGLEELLDERALASEHLADADLAALRAAMDEARARRLQPHYIELAFKAAFTRLGGRIAAARAGPLRDRATSRSSIRAAGSGPIATRYDRVTFDLEHVQPDDRGPRRPARPRPPAARRRHGRDHPAASAAALDRGTVLVSPTLEEPHLLVGVIEEVADATGDVGRPALRLRLRRQHGTVQPAGPAPYLDCVAAPDSAAADGGPRLPWLADAEDKATSWIIANQLPAYLAEVQPRRAGRAGQDPRTGHQAPDVRDASDCSSTPRSPPRRSGGGEKPKESSDEPQPQGRRARRTAAQALALLDQQQLDVDEAAADTHRGACAERCRSTLSHVMTAHVRSRNGVKRGGNTIRLVHNRSSSCRPPVPAC